VISLHLSATRSQVLYLLHQQRPGHPQEVVEAVPPAGEGAEAAEEAGSEFWNFTLTLFILSLSR
jgi:hypothetical protein